MIEKINKFFKRKKLHILYFNDLLIKVKEFEKVQDFDKVARIYEELDMWSEASNVRELARRLASSKPPMAIPRRP